MKDLCSENGCMHCPYQDTNYCPYETGTPTSALIAVLVFVLLILFLPLIFKVIANG